MYCVVVNVYCLCVCVYSWELYINELRVMLIEEVFD